jgi:hypothetical protein
MDGLLAAVEEGAEFGGGEDLFGDLVEGEVWVISGEAGGVFGEGGEDVLGGAVDEVFGAGGEGFAEDVLPQGGGEFGE